MVTMVMPVNVSVVDVCFCLVYRSPVGHYTLTGGCMPSRLTNRSAVN